MNMTPCKGCTDRSVTCHGECETYKEWAAMKRNERIQTNIEKANLDKMWNYGWKGGKGKK